MRLILLYVRRCSALWKLELCGRGVWVVFMLAILLGTGCIQAPSVVIVDRTTALEQQAGGRFIQLERALEQAGLSPRPQPYTRGQLDAVGWTTPRDRDAIARLAEAALRDRERLDALLLRRCIGEAKQGELTYTRRACQGAVDTAALSRLMVRANRSRRQIWLYLQRSSGRKADVVRRAWRKVQLLGSPCGAWIEDTAGRWAAKKCAK